MALRTCTRKFDVVVVGGGMAGVCAALACARRGVSTALIHNRPVLGGNASSEIRMHILGASAHGSKPDLAETGILMELLLENKRRNPTGSFVLFDTVLWEAVRFQDNLEVFLNTHVDEAETAGARIVRVRGRQLTTETTWVIEGTIFVDATGHGTLGVLAGAASRMGSEGRQEFGEEHAPDAPNRFTMGNTVLFTAVDRGAPVPFVKPDWAYTYTEEDLRFRHHDDSITSHEDGGATVAFEAHANRLPHFSAVDSGYWWLELGGDSGDIIANAEQVRDELWRCLYGVWDHLKNGGDHGADTLDLDWVGVVPGCRESRRLEGDYLLTEQDVRGGRQFADAVAYGGWAMDEHTPGGLRDRDKLPSRIYNFEGAYTIPYRCYYSRNIDNLMMAGRDISTTKMAFGSTRVMGTCAVGGQAVGTAAALAIGYGCTPRQVGGCIGELQQALLKDDCYIPGVVNTDLFDLARTAKVTATSAAPGCPPEKVIDGVARTEHTADGRQEHGWQSRSHGPLPGDGAPAAGECCVLGEAGEGLTLTFGGTVGVRELRITFDPDLTGEIMPTLTRRVRERQVKGMPPTLVRDFDAVLLRGQETVRRVPVRGNARRLAVLDLGEQVVCDAVRIVVRTTYGYPAARIF